MVDLAVADLLSLDRDVGRAFAALDAHRRSLASDPSSVASDDPFEGLRHVAGKSTLDALGALSPSAADVPLRDALRRWVGVFIQARIGLGVENEWAAQAAAMRVRFGGEAPRMVSWREAWRGVALSRSVAEARLWLDAAADAGPALAVIATTRAIRRVEVAHRLGQDDPWKDIVPASRGALRSAAWQLLRATEDLAIAARREAQEGEDAASTFVAAAARDASTGWPARLTPAWLLEAFRGQPRDASPTLDALPRPAGAASFARALHQFGFSVRLALGQTSLPFALAREPAFVAAQRFACLFGALPADPDFHVRVLGTGKSAARGQARSLGRTVLFEARARAARLLLGDEVAFAPSDVFPELTVRLFGSPLDDRLRGAWPPPREDDPARFIGMLQTGAFRRALRDRFDIDWFHNPRAWAHLRELSTGPARETVDEASLMTAADGLALELEEALG
jgi:hypothetical protein